MPTSEILKNLRQSVLFEQAPESVLKKVAAIVQETAIKAGEKLIEKGESGDSMYIICSGKVKVHDGDLLLSHLGKGHAFGEMAALDGEDRTASITAVEDTELIQLDRKDLSKLWSREPEVAKALIHFLCQRGKNVYSDITERSLKLNILEREFEIGRNIQAGFLPESLPEVSDWDIAAYFQAAREVAGDFYDVFKIANQGKIGLVIGDVCGKGVGAALFMTLFRSLLRAGILAGDFMTWKDEDRESKSIAQMNIHQVLSDSVALTNNYVALTHGSACMFATLFVGILDPQSGLLVYINAGHESPVILNSNGIKKMLDPTGPAAGLFPGAVFSVAETELASGDAFVAFTDGVTEAVNSENRQFTSQRLLDILINHQVPPAKEGLAAAVQQLKEFTADVEPFDDITLLNVKRM